MQRPLVPTAVLLLAAALALPAPASAEDSGHRIIRLCAEGKSLSGFPPSDYAKALKEMSATTEEYSECGQLIRQAQAAAASAGKQGSGPTGGALPTAVTATPAEQKEIAGAASGGGGPVSLGGDEIHPGVVHASIASAFSTLPTPLLALLAFALACGLALGARYLHKRFRVERTN